MQGERVWYFQRKSGWLPRSLKMNLFYVYIIYSFHSANIQALTCSRYWIAATDSLGPKKVVPVFSDLGLEICS